MTFISISKNENFFEQFNSIHITPHIDTIEEYELVYSSGQGVALSKPSSTIGRIWNWGTSYELSDNAKHIVDAAKATFSLISAPSPTTPKERIIATCRAASRTCLLVDRIVKRAIHTGNTNKILKELDKNLEEFGKNFLARESEVLEMPQVAVACQNATLHAALDLIKEGESILDAKGHYTPLLTLAFEQKQYKLCRQFISLGADPNAAFGLFVKEHSSKLLFHSIKEGQEGVAIVLVQVGAALNVSKDGKFPLHMAASAGFCQLAQEMIIRGADVNSLDRKHNTPLHDACRAYKGDMALLLLQKGADVSRINLEIDEETKIVKSGTCAFRVPNAGDRRQAVEFYCKILASLELSCLELSRQLSSQELSSHNFTRLDSTRELLLQGGIDAFLSECAANPNKYIRGLSGPNPFEIALLFQDSHLATKFVDQMPLKRFYDYFKKLKNRYPNCNVETVEFCYLKRSDAHLEKKLPQLDTYPPARDVSLNEIISYVVDPMTIQGRQLSIKEITANVRSFIARIQGKADMPGLTVSEAEKTLFYELIEERCLKNCIISFAFQESVHSKDLREKKNQFLREIVALELGEHNAGTYFFELTKLFRTFCKGEPKTFEDEIYIKLAELREKLLAKCLDPMKCSNKNAYNYLLARLGERLSIPGYDACKYYRDTLGHFDVDVALQEFFKLYTVSSIIKNCIEPALEQSKELRDKFCEWMVQKIPKEWGERLSLDFQVMQDKMLQAKPSNGPQMLRDFLRKNGVVIADDSTNYKQAIDAARQKAYIEQEIYENGHIKPVAISRMLANLEKPVFYSTKLQHEDSPTTFACHWLQDIIDMVKN